MAKFPIAISSGNNHSSDRIFTNFRDLLLIHDLTFSPARAKASTTIIDFTNSMASTGIIYDNPVLAKLSFNEADLGLKLSNADSDDGFLSDDYFEYTSMSE